ncbi:MAG TPA: radical SAM protein [Firmicutes bacterium]|nr:radical SAM protein [Bacillota bacterium]
MEHEPLSSMRYLRVSLGTAMALGLTKGRMDVPPTTAYFLVPGGCQGTCMFCPQARTSLGHRDLLSRVSWPLFPAEDVLAALRENQSSPVEQSSSIEGREGPGAGPSSATLRFQRACIQVVQNPKAMEIVSFLLTELGTLLPVSVSYHPKSREELARIFDLGAQRVGIALDCATEGLYRKIRGGSYRETIDLLEWAAQAFPGRISTHLIIGLGETEEEALHTIQTMYDLGITVGLFAFTPVPGTPLEGKEPPDPLAYRRVQVARWLISHGLKRFDDFTFDDGRVIAFGMSSLELANLLSSGEAFQTSGCAGCNRPYYNEKPGGFIYNYPRKLTATEAESIREALLDAI